MVGSRPKPTAPVYNFDDRPDKEEQNEGPAYLYITLPQFMGEMRKRYGDWEDFLDSRPGLYRALMSEEDLEW